MSIFDLVGVKLVMVGLAVVLSSQSLVAQDGSAETGRSFESQFWNYLIANNYKNWAPPAGTDGSFFRGQSPHGPFKKLYLNRTAAGNPAALPDESVIVLENYRSDKSLQSIDVMVRSTGTDAATRDWYFISYGPDGSIRESSGGQSTAADTDIQLATFNEAVDPAGNPAATSQSCVQCHDAAPGREFTFFNNPHQPNAADRELQSSH